MVAVGILEEEGSAQCRYLKEQRCIYRLYLVSVHYQGNTVMFVDMLV
jgi:hypothetical protein